jgi:YVTN family beta-propeller protein
MKRFLFAAAVLVIAGVGPAVPALAAQHQAQQNPPPVRTIAVGSNPIDVVISQRQSRAYVANDGSVSVLSLKTHRQLAEAGTGFQDQTAIGLVRCDSEAYIGTFDENDLKILNTKTLKVTGTVNVGLGATDIVAAQTKRGEYAYVTLLTANSVAVVKTSSNKVVKTIKLPAGPQTAETTPDGKEVWAGSSFSGEVWVVSTSSQQVTRQIPVPDSGPVSSISFTPDGQEAWVFGAVGVSVIDVATGHLTGFLPINYLFPGTDALNAGPIEVTADGKYALVVNSTFPDAPMQGEVAVVDTDTLHRLQVIDVGTEPTGLAIDNARHTAYVTNYEDDTVSYFSTPCDSGM